MSIKTEKLYKRLDKIEKILRPVGSLRAKIAALSPEDFEIYNSWKKRNVQYHDDFDGNAYEALLEKEEGEETKYNPPNLPSYLSNQLFPSVQITDNAREDYHKLLESI